MPLSSSAPVSRMAENPPPRAGVHDIDAGNIRDHDELNAEGERLCHVWCRTCGVYEWHWIMDDELAAHGVEARP